MGKLDEKVETRNLSVTRFTSEEFLVYDEFPIQDEFESFESLESV